MEYDFKEILDIGLEIEFSNIKRETPNFINNLSKKLQNFRHVHDASSETPELTLGNIPIQFDINGKSNKLISILRNKSLEVFGGELNSPIMSSDTFRENIYRLIDFLIDMGESHSTTEQDNRGSIHVHINTSKDIKHKHLIRLLEVGLATEALFYRLGGMGKINRGVKNSFIYQRPLTLPPCIARDGTVYPIFDYRDLLESKNKTDFYNKYGDTIYHIHNGNHYVTQRYTGLNFYSIPYRGSIEFRYANKILIPEWIIAWIILCQGFVNFALTKSKDESFENTYRKLEDNRDYPPEELKLIFDKFLIPEQYQITLFDIWRQTEIPTFNGKNILSHLQNPTYFSRENSYRPRSIEVDNIERIIVQDVRTVHSTKSMKMATSSANIPELDYIIDTTGVKTKIKEMGIRLDNYRNRADNYVQAWAMIGFDIRRYNENDSDHFVQHRIRREKFIPLTLLHSGEDYEYDTKFNAYKLLFNIADDYSEIYISFYDVEHEINCPYKTYQTDYDEALDSTVFNFTPIINECYLHPENFFREEDLNEILEEEVDEGDFLVNNVGNEFRVINQDANNVNVVRNIRWALDENNNIFNIEDVDGDPEEGQG